MAAATASPALIRLRGALADDSAVREHFSDRRLTPMLLAERCNAVDTPLHSAEIRALLLLFGDPGAVIDGKALAEAIIAAPQPLEAKPVSLDLTQAVGSELPPSLPPAPPSVPAALTSSLPDGWAPPIDPPVDGRAEQRDWLTQQQRPAPYAVLPEGVAPQWPEERTRPDKNAIGESLTHPLHLETPRTIGGRGYSDGYLGETAAAYAARMAMKSGMGAAGKGSVSVESDAVAATLATARAATLHVPNLPGGGTAQRPRTAPYAFDYYTGPMDVSDGAPSDRPAPRIEPLKPPFATLGATSDRPVSRVEPRAAPYATLGKEQLAEIAAHDAEKRERAPSRSTGVRSEFAPTDDALPFVNPDRRGRLGPQLWQPPPPLPRDAPAGMVPKFGDRSNDPLPNTLNWMTTGTSRPVSRRATGSARPATASSITFG